MAGNESNDEDTMKERATKMAKGVQEEEGEESSVIAGVVSDDEDEETPVPAGKVRMSQAMVDLILAKERKPFPGLCDAIQNPEPSPYMSQEFVEETREIFLAAAETYNEMQDKFAAFQDRIRREYEEKGVVDVDDDYLEKAREMNRAAYLEVFGGTGTPSD